MAFANGIKNITIKNIKGIDDKIFNLKVVPNQPSILVAHNGFGKSSFAAAFNSLKDSHIDLHEDHYHKHDSYNEPYISMTLVHNNVEELLEADSSSNTIIDKTDIVVISNKFKENSTNSFGRRRPDTPIKPDTITLVQDVPSEVEFGYLDSSINDSFAHNKDILHDIQHLLEHKVFIRHLHNHLYILDEAIELQNQNKIQDFIDNMSAQGGLDESAKRLAFLHSHIQELSGIKPLEQLVAILESYKFFRSPSDYYLSAIQIINLYKDDKDSYKKASEYAVYQLEKEEYINVFEDFHSIWPEVMPQESSGSLVLDFPKAHVISSAQIDVLNFIALLQKAKNQFSKQNCILIIDEIFDYLDGGNLVAVQYYISNFIDKLKSEDKNVYPLILTHLNPMHFNHYNFSRQNIHFLDERHYEVNASFKKLIISRQNDLIKDSIDKFYFHYNPKVVDLQSQFVQLSLEESWEENHVFYNYLDKEIQKYIEEEEYCPFSVCCALRVKIESLVYEQLSEEDKALFLDSSVTKEKLDIATRARMNVKETYYLLGVVYNDSLYWDYHIDKTIPIITNLENITIKNMIKKVYQEV